MKRKARSDKGIFGKNDIVKYSKYYEAILRNKYGDEIGRTKFDINDLDIVLRCQWHLTNYGYANNTKMGVLHRLIMNPKKGLLIDHINFDRLDNRRSNLRLATPLQNAVHTKLHKTNTSGYRGVTWKKDKNKWKAYIFKNNKQIHLGYFNSKIKAKNARYSITQKMYGEFCVG